MIVFDNKGSLLEGRSVSHLWELSPWDDKDQAARKKETVDWRK